MFRRKKSKFKSKFEVAVIAAGDTGREIGRGIISNLEERSADVSSLLVSTGTIDKKSSGFKEVFIIDKNRDGFSKQLDVCLAVLETKRDELRKVIDKVISQNKNKLLFVTTGAGATGLGSTMIILDILYKDYKMIPPILTVLPEVFENSRVQFNMATFLYQMVYKDDARGNSIIILDNKPSLRELDKPFQELSKNRVEIIPNAIGDLLYASFLKTIAPDFDASVSDLLEVIHTPGISVFVAETLVSEEGEDITRLETILADSVINNTSLSKDAVFEAKAAFITISDVDPDEEKLSFQTEFEARKLYKKFQNNRPYVKFVNSEAEERQVPMIHAIVAGLPSPARIIQIMQIARDSRKKVIMDEYQLSKETVSLDVKKIEDLEKELHELF